MSKPWRLFFIFLVSVVVLVFAASFAVPDSRLHLVFCDVGQGDAILIYRGSTQVLIDGGPDRSVLSCLSYHMPFWDRKIEALVLTNPDLDHYGGFVDVVRRYQISTFLTSGVRKESEVVKTLERELGMKEMRVMGVKGGDRVRVIDRTEEISLLTFWPTEEYLARLEVQESTGNVLGARTTNKPNEFSVVLGLAFGEFDALLTGDIEPPGTNQLVGVVGEMGDPTSPRLRGAKWEVLKIPHHGSKNGLTAELLEAVNPRLAVISVGKKNRYGHPARETLDILQKHNVKTLRTDLDGEIEIITDGREWGLR